MCMYVYNAENPRPYIYPDILDKPYIYPRPYIYPGLCIVYYVETG